MNVRLAARDDFKIILKMPPYSKIIFNDLLSNEAILVAENNGVIFGAVSIGHKDISYVQGEWRDNFEQRLNIMISNVSGGWISKLYVFPEYRYKGIAKILVKEVIKHLKEKNINEAYAGINVKNEFSKVSEHLFESNGFKRVGSCICLLAEGKCRGALLKKTIEHSKQKKK